MSSEAKMNDIGNYTCDIPIKSRKQFVELIGFYSIGEHMIDPKSHHISYNNNYDFVPISYYFKDIYKLLCANHHYYMINGTFMISKLMVHTPKLSMKCYVMYKMNHQQRNAVLGL